MAHDFKNFPELTNNQMEIYYFESPHKQITEDFVCQVDRVIDGDTIRVKWPERDFTFPVRLIEIAAPELGEPRGKESKSWLEKEVLGKTVLVEINPLERVGKWGRILGRIIHFGMDINQLSIDMGQSIPFENVSEEWGAF